MNSGFFYKSAEERDKLVKAERKFIEERVKKIIELKNKVCTDGSKSFVVINQKVLKNVLISLHLLQCYSAYEKQVSTLFHPSDLNCALVCRVLIHTLWTLLQKRGSWLCAGQRGGTWRGRYLDLDSAHSYVPSQVTAVLIQHL